MQLEHWHKIARALVIGPRALVRGPRVVVQGIWPVGHLFAVLWSLVADLGSL